MQMLIGQDREPFSGLVIRSSTARFQSVQESRKISQSIYADERMVFLELLVKASS